MIMKALMTICGLFLMTFGFAQQVEPTGEEIAPNTLKVTFYHSNGNVMHQGNYVNGKSDGLWKSYDEVGNLISEGSFEQGKKVGLWNFYKTNALSAVVYNDNAVASIKKFNTDTLAGK